MPSEQEEITDIKALAEVLSEVEQEYEMLTKERPELFRPQSLSSRPQTPNFFRRSSRGRR